MPEHTVPSGQQPSRIDPARDDLIPLSELVKRLPRRPAPSTIHRWLRKGVHGVRLNAVFIGGIWMTTEGAWRRFVAEQTTARLSEKQTNEPHAATDDELASAGLI